MYIYAGDEPSNSLSTVVVVMITVSITLLVSIFLTTIVMLILVKIYLLKRFQNSHHQPMAAEVPSLNEYIAEGIKEDTNPAYELTKEDNNPAYEILRIDDIQRNTDDLYY